MFDLMMTMNELDDYSGSVIGLIREKQFYNGILRHPLGDIYRVETVAGLMDIRDGDMVVLYKGGRQRLRAVVNDASFMLE